MTTLADLETALAAATPGEWQAIHISTFDTVSVCNPENGQHTYVAQAVTPRDSGLIAISRNTLPGILTALRAAEAWLRAHDDFSIANGDRAKRSLERQSEAREAFRTALAALQRREDGK